MFRIIIAIGLIFIHTATRGQNTACNIPLANACSSIELNLRFPVNRVFCEGENITITNNTTDQVDSTFYCWGDGRVTKVAGNGSATQAYDFPDDTCTLTGSTAVTIKIIAIKKCAAGTTVVDGFFSITIRYKPVASFSTTSPVCLGTPMTFSRDRRYCPNSNTAKYYFDYGDGSRIDTSPLPLSHTYTRTGNFTATLKIVNGCDSSTFSQTVNVQPLPDIKPTFDLNNKCPPATIQVVANGQFVNTYRWVVRNPNNSTTTQNIPNTSFTLTQTGAYTVTLEARGCSNRLITWDTMFRLIGAPTFRLDSIEGDCGSVTLRPSQLLTLTDTTVRTVVWRFVGPNLNDSTNQRSPADRSFSTIGTYTVSFSASNDCSTLTRSFTFSVDSFQQARINRIDKLCNSDATVSLVGNGVGGRWFINGVAASASFNPRTAPLGNNTIVYQLGRGACVSADTMVIRVGGSVVNAGTDVSVCSSEPTIQLPRATPTGGVWRGVGVVDSVNGIVRVNLIVSGSSSIRYVVKDTVVGCENFDDVVVRVAALPTATLGNRRNFCINEPFIFNPNGDRSLTYNWIFGDGGTSAEVSPTYTYRTAGSYQIRVTVRTSLGCIDSTSLPIEVGERGKALVNANLTEGCGPTLSVQLTNRSTGNGLAYFWRYGNGQTDTIRQPTTAILLNQANRDTTYRVWLRATNGCGADSAFVDVLVKAKPGARFGTDFNSNCSPMTVNLSNVSVGQPRSYRWFADGILFSTDSAPAPQVYRVFNNLSPRTIQILLVTENGCGIDSTIKTIQVVPPTTRAFFNTDTTVGCVPFRVRFTNFSTVGARVRWTISNGHEDTAQDTLDYTFRTAGRFTVWLYASNGCGYDSTKVEVEVKPAPIVGFRHVPQVCLGDSVRFIDTSLNVGIGQWSFGDSSFSTARNPVHVYQRAGSYNVRLQSISLSNGCLGTANAVVVVNPLPIVAIGVSDSVGCPPLSIAFTAQTLARQVTWFFDSANTSNLRQASFRFSQSGRFPIRLVVEDNNGCRNTAIFNSILVFDKPKADFNLQLSRLCGLPTNSVIQNNSIGGNTFQWSASGGQNSTLRTPNFSFTTEGVQNVGLIVENTVGCRDSSQKNIKTYAQPIANFTIAPNQLCERQTTVFTNLSQFFTNSNWSFGDGSTDTARQSVHRYTVAGSYRPRLTVSNQGVCFDTFNLSQSIQVFPSPKADFSFVEIVDPKPQGIVKLTDQSTNAISWHWLFTNRDTSTVRHPQYQFRLNGMQTVRLAVKSVNGCVDTLIKNIPITPFYGLFAPNTFAPDQKDWNEGSLFKPKGRGLKAYHAQVFSAIGDVLWESTQLNDAGEPTESWDGTNRSGVALPQGAYSFLIKATYINGENVFLKGTVTLMR
jgi:large repetitive protein